MKLKSKKDDKKQSAKFIEKAEQIKDENDKEKFDKAIKKIASKKN